MSQVMSQSAVFRLRLGLGLGLVLVLGFGLGLGLLVFFSQVKRFDLWLMTHWFIKTPFSDESGPKSIAQAAAEGLLKVPAVQDAEKSTSAQGSQAKPSSIAEAASLGLLKVPEVGEKKGLALISFKRIFLVLHLLLDLTQTEVWSY